MKTIIQILIAVAICATASADDRVLTINAGDTITVKAPQNEPSVWLTSSTLITSSSPERVVTVTAPEIKGVVRAMEILLRFAPEKYSDSCITFTTGSGSLFATGYSNRRTKADEVFDEAQSLADRAISKRDEARRIEKDQFDIEWARGVLGRWKAKL